MREKVIIFLIGLGLLVVIIGVFMLANNGEEKNFLNKIANLFTSEEPKNTEQTTPGGSTSSSSSSSSSGSSSGGSSSSSEGLSTPDCETEPLSYSLLAINKTETCNSEQNEICLDKTILCSLDVRNRDKKAAGNFKIELKFLQEGGSISEPIEKIVHLVFLEPEAQEHLEDSTTIQSTGEEGIANKNINCFYNTLEVPEKCIN